MDFGFHDDVLSLVLNIGTVFVSESIRHFKSTSTSEGGQIIETKSVEQTVLETLDDNVLFETATDAEIILNTCNDNILFDHVSDLECTTLDNLCIETNDFLETTADEIIAINYNDNFLLDINKDIDFKIDHDSTLLETSVDDEKNTCDIYDNDLIDASVIITPKLNSDNNNDLYHDIGDAKPTLISGNKEVLLDVTELDNIMFNVGMLDAMDYKIQDQNVFLDHTPVQVTQSKISRKVENFKKFIRKFKIGKPKETTVQIRTVSSGRLKSKLGIPQSRKNGF
ncbi:hypothetical protein CDAR_454371 [Caerostris darwini]|uniref:Uncharacterized protein n=1 Tax=Caerostris darwini TaxID=1538125 RepID=A0AAV4V735_9ARAC|nr:hypothetical protein CDAR_454371 [Caerostris darwini]